MYSNLKGKQYGCSESWNLNRKNNNKMRKLFTNVRAILAVLYSKVYSEKGHSTNNNKMEINTGKINFKQEKLS